MVVKRSVELSIPANATGYSSSDRESVVQHWLGNTSLTATVND